MKISRKFDSSQPLSADFGREILDLLIETVYLALIFVVPLWFAYFFPTYNIFEFNKAIVLKIIFWLLFFFTALKLVFFGRRLNFPWLGFFKKYWLWPLVFIAGLSVSILFSDNPLLSFYGTVERQAGLNYYLLYFACFILLSFNILTLNNHWPVGSDNKSKKIRRIIISAFVSASLVATYGILQILNIDFLIWPEAPYLTHRIVSTFGQPNFLASWLLLVIPAGIYLGWSERRFLIKSAYFFGAALQLIALFFTGSRGGLAAFFFAVAVYVIYLLATSAWSRRRKIFIGFSFLVLSVLISLSAAFIWSSRSGGWGDYQYGSIGARANFYVAAVDAIKARPAFGYGLEGGDNIFIKYYEPDWAVYGDVGQSADRAHNLVLDIVLSAGFYGLALSLVLYYFFFSLAVGNIRKKKMPSLSLALALGAAAYLFSLLFSFSIVAGEIYFWLFLAMLVAINYQTDEEFILDWPLKSERIFFRKILYQIIKIAAVSLFTVLVYWRLGAAIRTLSADYYFNKIYFLLAEPDYFTALVIDDYLKEEKTNPINQASYDSFWGEKLSEAYRSIDELTPKKVVRDKLEAVAMSLPENSYKDLLVKAKINNALGRYQIAQDYLDKVIAITPYWPLVYLEQGKLSINEGNFKEALVAYNLALLNLPSVDDRRLNDPHRDLVRRYQYFIYANMGAIYERQNNFAAAEKYFSLAYQSNPDDFVLLKRMADMEYRRGDLVAAAQHTAHGSVRNPGDYKWLVALASLYQEQGKKDKALDLLGQALKLAPDDGEIGQLISEYKK